MNSQYEKEISRISKIVSNVANSESINITSSKCSAYYSTIISKLQSNHKQLYKASCSKARKAEVENIINGNVKEVVTIFKKNIEERVEYDKNYISNLSKFMPLLRNILLNVTLEVPSI